jgi:hypothetical protein
MEEAQHRLSGGIAVRPVIVASEVAEFIPVGFGQAVVRVIVRATVRKTRQGIGGFESEPGAADESGLKLTATGNLSRDHCGSRS